MLETAVQGLATIGLAIAKNTSFLTKIVTLVQIFYLERDAIPKYLHHEIDESLVIIQRCYSKLSNKLCSRQFDRSALLLPPPRMLFYTVFVCLSV